MAGHRSNDEVKLTSMRLDTQLLPEFRSEYIQNFVMTGGALFSTGKLFPEAACSSHRTIAAPAMHHSHGVIS